MTSDKQFIHEFETLTLDPDNFDHRGHIRAAWLYLTLNSEEDAITKVAKGIKRYACSLGATDKFHQTMTEAFIRIIASRQKLNPNLSWVEFLQQNKDLLLDAKALISTHYSDEIIGSSRAKAVFVQPDKDKLP